MLKGGFDCEYQPMPWVIGEDELRFGNDGMKWTADFGLTEPIHCEHDTANIPDIEFKFGKVKEQTTIQGFKITVETYSEKEAEIIVKKRADKLTDILSATSGTFLECTFQRKQPSDDRVSRNVFSTYHIRKKAILNISDNVLQEILNGNHSLNKRLGYIRDARRAERSQDWASVIKYLRHEQQVVGEPLRHLRNLLEHPDDPNGVTKAGIAKHYPLTPDDGLKLDGDRFDPTDAHNAKSIKMHAKRFLDDAHRKLRADMANLG